MSYLDLATFKARTLMPGADVDALEALYPGWIAVQLDEESDRIDARLRKRYEVPFASPYPKAVLRWLTAIVTASAYLKRGVDPDDLQAEKYFERAAIAEEEIKEAANAVDGLFDLPLRSDTTASGISKGGALTYSEQSPYVWTDGQVDTGRTEDSNRRGTSG